MKIHLPIIDNGGGAVKANWAMCMMAGFNGREIQIDRVSDSHADRACNKAASLFLASDCTDMLIIDTDILFRKVDIDRILSHEIPGVICGVYPKKNDATESCLGTYSTVETRPDGLAEVRWAGRGFMRIRREVLEAMKEESGGPAKRFHNYGEDFWDFFPSGPVEGDWTYLEAGKREWISEDIYFCLRAKRCGFPVYADLGIALGHEGAKEYRFNAEQITRVDSNIKSWQEIGGWFDYEDLYRELVATIPDGGKFVEVGSWLGRSIAAFATFAKEAGKEIEMHVVDTFEGEPANPMHAAILQIHGGNVEKMFRANITALGFEEIVVHAKASVDATNDFRHFHARPINAVFIDGDHSYESVAADIRAWYDLVEAGGIIAGHDYDEEGVKRAVDEFFGYKVETIGRCWKVQL